MTLSLILGSFGTAVVLLYNVSKGSLEESLESGLERLRREFVLRGSRSASGSQVEEMCLEAITLHLADALPTLRSPLALALVEVCGRIFQEVPYWQEKRFETSLKRQIPGISLIPVRLNQPLSIAELIPESSLSTLTLPEQNQLRAFVVWSKETLPVLLDKGLRRKGLQTAREFAANRPYTEGYRAIQEYHHRERESFLMETAHRWNKVGQVVKQQADDWMRVGGFAVHLVNGVIANRSVLDEKLSALSAGWSLERQVSVDRNIMRIAAYELLHLPDIPVSATINEAVEMAKKYSTAESGRFVNGVLGALSAQRPDASLLPQPEIQLPDDMPDKEELPEIEDIEPAEDAEDTEDIEDIEEEME